MQIKNKQDFWAGVMFLLIGAVTSVGATQYTMGTPARMGPGYFPFWLGLCLAVLGAIVALSALSPKAEKVALEKFDWKIIVLVIGPVALSGILLSVLGIYLSVFILVVLSSAASHVFSLKVAVINGVLLAIFVWLAFVKGLGLIFPLWPSFMGL